ncbi:flagellar hook capping FlgD N-terminal domain-containing protein [Candidatus Magnetobacterium casense]|uniref:flagellar hook capping FlgD N-terminal domain-containing protein n=1 Tax=Candidatus Magnetobacterium casense TaxID=1455061 RepID=UPI00058FF0DA|nr:flagellar hook capping FlgD N-terminal domain-containing protein [Candidatus Magnetobacterium casensis]
MTVTTDNTYTSSASSGASSASASSSTSTNELGKDDFLKLFTSQLKYQDPLNPMDSTSFTTQLAQFSSLEQLYNINSNIKTLTQYENSLNNVMAVSMIGKSVTTTDNTTALVSGISFDNGVTYLSLDNGEKIMMSNVTEISAKK